MPVLELADADAPCVEAIWRSLETTARPTYFLTWGWMENWIALLPPEHRPQLAVIRSGDAITAACFLGARRELRHLVLPSRILYVNATGRPELDELCIEHNGLLARPGSRWPLPQLLRLLPADWDELYLPGTDPDLASTEGLPLDYRVRLEREVPSPFVELDRVRAAGDYLALLSANTRAQIRRARRRIGPIELDVAGSLAEAFAIYDELVTLHAETWRARGQDGAFADPWIDRFHRRLIERRFAWGDVQLVRVRAGGQTVGCLYNLVAYGRVLFYQSGLAAYADPAIKPGLLVHAAAVERCAALGHATYDFLGGTGRYKQSLATASTPLHWLRVQRPRLRFAIEDRLRDWKHALAGAFT